MHTAIIVDDEPLTRLDLSQMLEEIGFDVLCTVEDGFDAAEVCRERRPDIVLLDINMPVFDGFTAMESIIREGLAKTVLVISGYSERAMIERAIKLGAGGYLVKPVDIRQLLPAVSLAIANAERLEALNERAAKLENDLADAKLIDRAKAMLARDRGISESEAYRSMQKLAMDKRSTIASLAKWLVENSSDRELVNRAKEAIMKKQGLSEETAYKRLQAFAKNSGASMAAASREVLSKGGLT